MTGTTEPCFGCQRTIEDGEPRVHIGVDEWGQLHGETPMGLGFDIRVAFCNDCTTPVEHGQVPVHEALGEQPPGPPEPGPPEPPRPPLHRPYS